ncbi:MAG TPA: hypothetical protein VHJ20_09485 [Polyangia bacterium]|nr:hypothetical protein [Polyangia bacterium]
MTAVPPTSRWPERVPIGTPTSAPTDQPPQTVTASGSVMWWRPHPGAALLLGGGFEDFTRSNVRAMTGGGGTWDARLVAGTREIVGLEAAYVGSARSIQTLTNNNSNLISNGVEGDIRLNLPLVSGTSLIEPFGFIGLGWQHYHVTNTPAFSDVASNDDVMTLPLGAGLEASYRGFMVDARFTYRQTYLNNLLSADPNGGRLDTWGVGGNVGVEF